MTVFYNYCFQLPYESVGAMAQVKVGSGCNFLGYYMYHGGTNQKGKFTPYLNENAVPKFSYDYQVAIGEFGQIRDSYKELKLQHIFYQDFQKQFCHTKTTLSEESKTQKPEDVDTLRYVARIDENGSGYLFINNYQDYVETKRQKDFAINVSVLPEDSKEIHLIELEGRGGKRVNICTLPMEDAMNLWKFKDNGEEYIMLSGAPVLPFKEGIKLEVTRENAGTIKIFPPKGKEIEVSGEKVAPFSKEACFDLYEIEYPNK